MKQELIDLLESIESLPTLPHVVSKIADMVQDPRVSAYDVQRVISQDQSLTATTLKLANSAYYGLTKRVKTVTQAVVILGFAAVKNIALTATIFKMFFHSKGDQKVVFDRAKLWKHSIGTAVAARVIARQQLKKDGEELFIAGLLHDVGKVVMSEYIQDDFLKVLIVAERDSILFYQAEKKVLEYDHCKIGKWLIDMWNLPPDLNESITYHHFPERAKNNQEDAAIIALADIFTRSKMIGSSGDFRIPKISREIREYTDLKINDIEPLMYEFAQEFQKAEDFIELL